jgi:hypothetical protein
MQAASPGHAHKLSGNIELTFLGHPLKSFGRAFDPVLAIVAIGRKQPDNLIGAAGGRTRDIAGRKIDGLSNVVFVLQRPLHHARCADRAHGPAATIGWKTPVLYSMETVFLASCIRTWPIRGICRFFSMINARFGRKRIHLTAAGNHRSPASKSDQSGIEYWADVPSRTATSLGLRQRVAEGLRVARSDPVSAGWRNEQGHRPPSERSHGRGRVGHETRRHQF